MPFLLDDVIPNLLNGNFQFENLISKIRSHNFYLTAVDLEVLWILVSLVILNSFSLTRILLSLLHMQ